MALNRVECLVRCCSACSDDLLIALKSAGYGCFVGHMFTGVLAYADDLVLLAPSQHAMRQMLRICEGYAGEYDMLFNAVQNLAIILIDIVLCPTLSYVAVLLRWLTVGHMLSCHWQRL